MLGLPCILYFLNFLFSFTFHIFFLFLSSFTFNWLFLTSSVTGLLLFFLCSSHFLILFIVVLSFLLPLLIDVPIFIEIVPFIPEVNPRWFPFFAFTFHQPFYLPQALSIFWLYTGWFSTTIFWPLAVGSVPLLA